MPFLEQIDAENRIIRPILIAPGHDMHKYDRGHALVFSGPALRTGASRLTAQAALAVGAGLVTIVGEQEALKEHSAHVTAIMLRKRDSELQSIDARVRALAIGPAHGIGSATRGDILALAGQGRPMVIDADGITAFEDQQDKLIQVLHSQCVLTPHEGEFARIFPKISLNNRLEAARSAASLTGAVILLKGAETVIAASNGRYALNNHANGWLATAGAGDVLTGLICGIMAQGLGAFRAACVACWLHGDIAIRFGAGLTADRMIDCIPETLKGCLVKGEGD